METRPLSCKCGTLVPPSPSIRRNHGLEAHSPFCPVGKWERENLLPYESAFRAGRPIYQQCDVLDDGTRLLSTFVAGGEDPWLVETLYDARVA